MKKLFLAIAAVAMVFATSCKKENVNEPVNPEEIPANSFLCEIENGSATQKILSRIGDGMGTMANIEDGKYVIWEQNDQISVNNYQNGGLIFTNNQPTATRSAGGRAYFEWNNGPFQATEYYAFYPEDIQNPTSDQNNKKNHFIMKDNIFYDPSHPAAELPMFAYSNTNHWLTFHNICAVLEITIPAEITTCTKIVLSSDNAMSGHFAVYNYTDATPVASYGNDEWVTSPTTKTITRQGNGGVFAAEELVYVAIPARSYTNFQIELFDATDEKLNQTKKQGINVAVNTIYPVTITPQSSGGHSIVDTYFLSSKFNVGTSASQEYVQFTKGNLYYASGNLGIGNDQLCGTAADAVGSSAIWQFFFKSTAAAAASSSITSVDGSLFCGSLGNYAGTTSTYVLSQQQWYNLFDNHAYAKATVTDNTCTPARSVECCLVAPCDFSGTIESTYRLDQVISHGFLCLPVTGMRYGWGDGPYDEAYAQKGPYMCSDICSNGNLKLVALNFENDDPLEDWPGEGEDDNPYPYNSTASIRLVRTYSAPSSIKGKNVLHF